MVPVRWSEFGLTRNVPSTIKVAEELAALPMVVLRADLPLTAAAYFLDLIPR